MLRKPVQFKTANLVVNVVMCNLAHGAWADWIACDNEYAAGDHAAVEAGALDHLNTIAVRLRRR